MRESAIEKYLGQRVKAMGGLSVKLSPTILGIPDRLVVLPGGRHYFVELKQPRGRLSEIQKEIHRRLETLGHPVAVLWNKQEVDLWLEFR